MSTTLGCTAAARRFMAADCGASTPAFVVLTAAVVTVAVVVSVIVSDAGAAKSRDVGLEVAAIEVSPGQPGPVASGAGAPAPGGGGMPAPQEPGASAAGGGVAGAEGGTAMLTPVSTGGGSGCGPAGVDSAGCGSGASP